MSVADRMALKKRLGRTWSPFFERYGNFTPVQMAAIPVLLDGHNAIVSAPTASGKTSSVIVPLIERHCPPGIVGLRIVYLTPTRALVNDIVGRLWQPLDYLGISLASKTHDANTFNPQKPANLLITTPESLDSLLTSHARILAHLRGVVLDELHLFDQTPRGDQLRVLLRRLEQIRQHAVKNGDDIDAEMQMVALSATLTNPKETAGRYFQSVQVIQVDGSRALEMDLLPLAKDSVAELLDYMRSFRSRHWRKALIFCNSRLEAETYAAAIRQQSPFGDAVYVHYSNIAPVRRLEIEEKYAQDEVAVCFATNTLELGIDVGNIDVVILIGPPGNRQSFDQRIGRGNRRQKVQRVTCFYRSPLERLIFQALSHANNQDPITGSPYHLSVVVQQIFSLIKQSPHGGVRLNNLSHLLDGLVQPADLQTILAQLQHLHYLKTVRTGEWRPDTKLNDLFDQQARADCELSIYGNIQNSGGSSLEIRDHYTHQPVARVDTQWLDRSVLTLEGRPIRVEWVDGEAMWVSPYRGEDRPDQLRYRGTKKQLSFELAQFLPAQFNLEPSVTPMVETLKGWWWFHWAGDLYGQVLLHMLNPHMTAKRTKSPGLCLLLLDTSGSWPTWTPLQVQRHIEANYRSLEPLLNLGAFHRFLPASLRRQVVVEQFNIARYVDYVNQIQPRIVRDELADALSNLTAN